MLCNCCSSSDYPIPRYPQLKASECVAAHWPRRPHPLPRWPAAGWSPGPCPRRRSAERRSPKRARRSGGGARASPPGHWGRRAGRCRCQRCCTRPDASLYGNRGRTLTLADHLSKQRNVSETKYFPNKPRMTPIFKSRTNIITIASQNTNNK